MSNVIELELSVDKIRSLAQSFCICWLLSDMKYQAEAHCVYMRGKVKSHLTTPSFQSGKSKIQEVKMRNVIERLSL